MEGVRTFLESSTIHGLTYISTARKYARIFWILVVITGFIGASLIIKESFDSWSESPVKTTIETLPIDEIKFPKVTVCPPRNTFTDVNYDLMMSENITLTEEIRDEMYEYALEVINEDSQSNWTKLHEEDRTYNWYHGFTEIKLPYYRQNRLNIEIDTSATSGVITSRYFGEQFRPELVEKKIYYKVSVHPPDSVMWNENVTLHFKLEKVSMKRLASGSKDMAFMEGLDDVLDVDQTIAYTNFTPPEYWKDMWLSRDVRSEEVDNQNMDVMPGFKFSWWYTGAKVTPENIFTDEWMNKQFVR